MKGQIILMIFFYISFAVKGQEREIEVEEQQQWETLAEMDDQVNVEDLDASELEKFKRHPVHLNKATREELRELSLLTDIQVNNFISYRNLLGNIVHIYELQAIPGWDLRIIKRLLPYITITDQPLSLISKLWKGDQQILLRFGKPLEKSRGFRDEVYLGSNDKMQIRYRFTNKHLRWGIAADKDAGESVFGSRSKGGFDFYTIHFFLRKYRFIEALAIGDFTVNMGQGLIQWQSLAFKKSASVLHIKREAAVLKAYTATGEVNFMRGAGITVRKKYVLITLFSSLRKVSGHLESDTNNGLQSISSFITSGNHRTVTELRDRNNIGQFTSGIVLHRSRLGWQFSLNTIYHQFTFPIKKKEEPYNRYALTGRHFLNSSINYSYTVRNLHLFGEVATDKHRAVAAIHGLLLSIDRRLDLSLVFRNMGRRYQSVAGNAFTEASLPNNEVGLYSALSFKPSTYVTIDAYFDIFRFPWLKYRVNAPSSGKDMLISLIFKPNKQVDCYARYKHDNKYFNHSGSGLAVHPLQLQRKESIRLHAALKLSSAFTFQSRMEFTFFKNGEEEKQEGAMLFADLAFKPSLGKWSVHGRLQLFNIDSYEARIYAYENRGPGSFSIPALYGNGKKYLVNVNHHVSAGKNGGWKIQSSLGWMQTFYKDVLSVGTGFDEVQGNHRSEIFLQLSFSKN